MGFYMIFLLIPSFVLPKTLNFDAINHCKLRLSLASYRIAASGLRILCLDSSPFKASLCQRLRYQQTLFHP